MNQTAAMPQRPWYRQLWPWLLMIPPLTTVVFWSVILTSYASPPSLVVDDYAKIGLTYSENRERDRVAAERGISARVQVQRGNGEITVALAGLRSYPEQLNLALNHPFEAELDRSVGLNQVADGVYRGRVREAEGRRRVLLGPVDGSWRLTGELTARAETVELQPVRR